MWELIERGLQESGSTGGCVLLVGVGADVTVYTYGYSDRAHEVPFAEDTVFCIGSITKQFTAAAIVKAQELGLLRIDQAIAEFIPQFSGPLRDITLHHLLTHTAGLNHDYGVSDWEAVSRDELVQRVNREPLLSSPGVCHSYSNAGYSLLAAVLEIAFGSSYEQVLATHLLNPAGLCETGYILPTWDRTRVAHNYADGVDRGPNLGKNYDLDGPFWNLRGNGGLHSIAADLLRWHEVLKQALVLSKESVDLMSFPHVPEGEDDPSHYGYGWVVAPTRRNTRVVWHNGGDGVLTADFRRYVDDDVVLIAAANDNSIQAWDLTQSASDHIFA